MNWRWNHCPYLTKVPRGSGDSGEKPAVASYASSVPEGDGAETFEATLGDRRSIPAGIFSAQNCMGLPKTRTATPAAIR